MPKIVLTNVTKRWGGFYAVENLNLVIEDNSFVTLLGPSGCGKTTTLRMIAGLETPTSGRITIGEEVVFDSEKGINIPASKRRVGFLFQNYALWPNMTVYQNISFGLKNIKEPMPSVAYDLKSLNSLILALKNPEKILELFEDCKDKHGIILSDRVLIKFIANYSISIYTAKKLYSLIKDITNVTEESVKPLIEDLQKSVQLLMQKYEQAGYSLNENYELIKDGKVEVTNRRLSKEEIDLEVRRVSRIVKIEMFMDRYPAELSGGQQQRVAIARTLAPGPSVLFMDEPLSNLDAKLRLEMRYELQRLHVETGSTFVYVTHDQMEAMTLATKICLINNGVLQQYQEPLKVYNYPVNTFVADFVGNPSINFLEAEGKMQEDGNIHLTILDNIEAVFEPNQHFDLDAWYKKVDEEKNLQSEKQKEVMSDAKFVEKANKDETFKYHVSRVTEADEALRKEYLPKHGDFVLGIRPEGIEISEEGKILGDIYGAMPTGMESTMKIRVGEYLFTSVVFGGVIYPIGSKVKVDFTGNKIPLFDRITGRLIASGRLIIK